MARNRTEAEVIVTLNGETARSEMKRLEEEIKKYEKAAEDAFKAGDKAMGNEMRKKAEQLKKEFKVARKEMKDFSDTIKNLDSKNINELRSTAKQLESQIRRLSPASQEYAAKSEQLKQVRDRIKSLESAYKSVGVAQESWLKRVSGISNAFLFFGQIGSYITGLSMKFRKCAEDAAKLDDVYADVIKTTGLLHDQVEALDKELMKIDTRTSREQLLLLARDAGKLGITGTENILGFVRAADQIQVALGEDLGEGAIKNLGKIADVFGLTQEMGIEKSLLSIASAVNALGQASTASEAYLVDFTQRLAGVGAMAGLSVQDILGFASGLDQSAMKVEMASTAFQKFLMKMYEDTATFAGYANMEVEEFSEMLKTNANEAIITVMKAMNGQDGFASLVPMFDQMGLDGARAVTVLASMTQNLEAVTEAQALANAEFAKGTSVTDEYNTKNNNLQAQLEKARKEFKNASIALGQSLNPVLLKSTKGVTYLIKALANYGKEIKAVLVSLTLLTVAVKASTIAHTVYNTVVKGFSAIQATATVAAKAFSYTINILRGRTIAATKAYIAMKAAMSTSVFGVVATALGALVAVITHYVNKAKEAADITSYIQSIEEKVTQTYAEEESRLRTLHAIVRDNNISLDQRKKALQELQEIVPAYHASLTKEGLLIEGNTNVLEEYIKKLREATRWQVYKDEWQDKEKELIETQDKLLKARDKAQKELEKADGNATEKVTMEVDTWGGGTKMTEYVTDYGRAMQTVRSLEEKEADILSKQNEIRSKMGKLTEEETKELSLQEKEIQNIENRYTVLFDEIKNNFVGDPSSGAEAMGKLQEAKNKEIDAVRKKYSYVMTVETQENENLTQAQFDFLEERYDKLNKKEQAMVDAGYASLSVQESKALKARYDKLMKADSNAIDKRYQQEMKAVQQQQRAETNRLNRQYFEREISAEKHEEELRRIKMESLQEQFELAKKYGKDTTQIEADILKEQMSQRKSDYEKEVKICERKRIEEETILRKQFEDNIITQEEFNRHLTEIREKHLIEQRELAIKYKQDGSSIDLKDIEARQKEEERMLKQSLTAQEITQEQYDARMLEIRVKYLQERLELARQNGQDETTILQSILDAQVEAEMLAFEQIEKLKRQAKDVKAGLSPQIARSQQETDELKKLDLLHEAKLLSEEEYEKAVRNLHKKYAQANLQEDLQKVEQYTQQVNTLMQAASDFVGELKEAESAKLEAQYQADLTAVGDNAEKREQIEAEYEQKKLDLQKKYADTEMVINIAKTIAAGALAAVQAVAQLGPIAGGIMAGVIAATTAAEVATIVAQRNAIKNASVNSSASTSTTNTGTREINGFSEGGYTDKDSSDKKVVGVVHANEWVAPAPMVRKNPVLFANLEQYRKEGFPGSAGTQPKGFAAGGFTGNDSSIKPSKTNYISKADIEAAVESAIAKAIEKKKLHAIVQYGDILIAEELNKYFSKQTSR